MFYKRFVIEAPKKEYPLAQSNKEEQLQDLDYLSLYIDYDKSFDTDEKKAAFTQSIADLENQLPLSEAQFEMAVAKIMAIANNTHTNINPSSRAKRLNAVPLRFYWFEEGLYIVLTRPEYKNLLGKKVHKINGFFPKELLSKLKPWYGGSTYRLKFFSPLYFMSPELLNAIDLGADDSMLNITYFDEDENLTSQDIPVWGADQKNPSTWPPYWLNPSKETIDSGWLSLIPPTRAALPFQSVETNVWHQFTKDGLYVKLNENTNTETRNVTNYLEQVLQDSKSATLEFVILDLRFNPGGDYHLARAFIEEMNGRINTAPFYIITDNGTFSAGIMTAVIAKHTLGSKAKIVGEPVGDRLTFWADGGSVMRLPNSKIQLRIWTAYHDWQNGCTDWDKCFWITIFDGVAVDDIYPDTVIPLKFSDYINGKDSALNFILND